MTRPQSTPASTPTLINISASDTHRVALHAVAEASQATHTAQVMADCPSAWAAAEAWVVAIKTVQVTALHALNALDSLPPELQSVL